MCFFPFTNNDIAGKAYKKGVREFECGACPECLAKRARKWALRCSMQSFVQKGCMITLTYDTFKRDENGNIIGENLNLRNVDKKDVQKFIKRLRSFVRYEKVKEFDKNEYLAFCSQFREKLAKKAVQELKRCFRQLKKEDDYIARRERYVFENLEKIAYLATAEYGSRTHRPHYHVLIFGYNFPDRVFYKKSKRGNRIYMSNTLNRLWNNGICTVDTVNLSAKVARYCTKYCAKDGRTADTFMLFSRGIGDDELMRRFNGKSYIIDGKEYPIPKQIWQKWLCEKYGLDKPRYISYRNAVERYGDNVILCGYRKRKKGYSFIAHDERTLRPLRGKPRLGYFYEWEYEFKYWQKYREYFRTKLEHTREYKQYLKYWQEKGELYEKYRPSVLSRVLALSNGKYFAYKQACLRNLTLRNKYFRMYGTTDYAPPPPRSGCISRYERYYEKWHLQNNICPPFLVIKGQMTEKRFKPLANDWQYRPLKDEDNPFIPKLGQIRIEF